MILIRVPQVEHEEEIPIEVTGSKEGPIEGEPTTKKVKKMIDEDQKDRALALAARDIPTMKVNFFVHNRYAGGAYRDEFLDYINRSYSEFFDENKDQEELQQAIHAEAQADLDRFIQEHCGEYEDPCLPFDINAPEL